MVGKKNVRHHAKKNFLGQTGKVPVLATGSLIFPIMEQYDAYKGGAGLAGQIYHPSGFDMNAHTWNPNQVVAYWKKPLIGAIASYAAQKVGAQKVTNKIPILGKYFRL